MSKAKPWLWVPTLYFAEGIPYFIVNTISTVMFKRLGMPNGELAMWTSLLYLPWVIKPLWSPLVDTLRTKRWWILVMQFAATLGFAALSLSVAPDGFGLSLVIFYILAFISSTHDIAADGFYMLALDNHEQSLYVGIRSLAYRISSIFGQGVIVVLAGKLEERSGDIPLAWKIALGGCSLIFLLISIMHSVTLPKVERTTERKENLWVGIQDTFIGFFKKPGILLALVFMFMYRLPEALVVKMLNPFLLDEVSAGGLGFSTSQAGLVYGTVGTAALVVGGILGGFAASVWGLRKSMIPMALSLALPCIVYFYLAAAQPEAVWQSLVCIALDQFGYGFGFTAYMLYLMYFSKGGSATSHYAICTAFMALSMMIPGIFAGWLQEALGYVAFFGLVMLCCIVTIVVSFFTMRSIPADYGKK